MKYHETPQSSNIAKIGYEPAQEEMHVHFSNGSVYAYRGVKPTQFGDFKRAESAGSHFNATFRGWPCKKIG